jgi:hypothetical protein
MKILSIVFILIFAMLGFSCNTKDKFNISPTPNLSKNIEIKPIFNATSLAGKSPKEVDKILGSPTDSWTMRGNSKGQMQSYALGEETTVEFHKNRIESLVIFFNQKNVDSETAYRLVGLDFAKPNPVGISNIETGSDWIKIFY